MNLMAWLMIVATAFLAGILIGLITSIHIFIKE